MIRAFPSLLFLIALFLLPLSRALPVHADTAGASPDNEAPVVEQFKRIKVVFEPDAYYSDVGLILSLTQDPIPEMGEQSEAHIYRTLLSRAALLPRYLVLEGSVNPLPYLGTYVKRNHPGTYENAQISGSFNWIQAITAGFEEPYAVSLLAGNVVAFDVAGSRDIRGNGYSGYLFSAGSYHIKDNTLIRDRWREIEWKMKGDRKSPVKKLSWSFRIGAKLHGNPDITDILYLSFRRSRLDYRIEEASLLNNSGFEYTVDLDRRTLNAIRHYFYVEKKWPVSNGRLALTLASGFVWESARKYTGPLADVNGTGFQILFRPNIEF
jgi:hypothetical protein